MKTNRIYVADLAEYNNGNLKGVWIDLPNDNLWNEVNKMLGSNEEWAIHDYELPFSISEYEDLDKLNDLATQYEQLEDQDIKKINYLINYNGASFEEAIENYEDVELYEDMTMLQLAEMFIDETWEVPEHLVNYIDADKFAYDLSMDYAEIDNDIYRAA